MAVLTHVIPCDETLGFLLQCSAKCGRGTQQRLVVCARSEGTELYRLPDSECDPENRMLDHQDCNGTDCAGTWFAGPYGKVDTI